MPDLRRPIGSVLGSYRILGVIGEGGVGVVYEAEHVRLGRKMALKVLHPELASQTDVVARFFNEARAVNEIRHPHIVDVEDFVAQGGVVYMLLERLHGHDLHHVIAKDGLLEPSRVAHLGAQIADALGAAHAVGIVHRDLKPDNVFLVERDGDPDFVKVLDFGIAKFGNEDTSLTKTGTSVGTPEYMAPEQILGRAVDGRTDVYALGMILYEALCGAPAFRDTSSVKVLRAQCTQPVPPPSTRRQRGTPIPAALEAAVMRCLEKAPEHRFGTMAELRAALLQPAAAAGPSRRATADAPAGPLRAAPRPGRTRQLYPPLALAVAALVLAYLPRGLLHGAPGPAAPPPANAPAPSAAAPAPPAEPEVEIMLVSKPPRAELFLGAERKPLGPAPVTTRVRATSTPLTLTARFADGTEVQEVVVPDRDLPPVVFVEPVAAAPAPPDAGVGPPDAGVAPVATAPDAGSEPVAAAKPAEPEEPRKKSSPKRPKKKKRRGGREGTIDPFAQ